MKNLFIALAASLALAAPAQAAASDPLMVPIHQFMDGFNTGNEKSALAAFAPAVSIIDDIPPHVWTGPDAMTAWVKDLTAAESKAKITGGKVTIGIPTREISDGSRAYVVVPTVYHFLDHGKPMHDAATMTFALQKISGKWLIAGWSWNGSVPKPGK